MDGLMTDLKYTLRNVVKRPGFYAAIVLTLALGIGANTGIFTLLDALLLRPLPYEDPDRLVNVWETVRRKTLERRDFSYPDFLDLRERAGSFEGLAAYEDGGVSLNEGESSRVRAEIVSGSYFAVLGVEPLLGRTFSEEPGAAASEVLLGYDLWQRIFAGASDAVGRQLRVDGSQRIVVGVMPRGFRGLDTDIELWTSMAAIPRETLESRGRRWHRVVGRLRPEVTLAQADDEVSRIFARLREASSAGAGYGGTVEGLVEDLFGDLRLPLSLLLGAVAFVLLIACANVANLLLIRATGRRRESALRKALGASRARMARQFLIETLTVTLAGGALALLVAGWGVDLLVALNPMPLPGFVSFKLDLPVLVFNLAVACATALALSLVETWQVRDLKLAAQLREGDRGGKSRESRRGRRFLVVGEMALAIVLMIGAGLMTKSLQLMRRAETGFDARDLVFFRVDLPVDGATDERARLDPPRLAEELRKVPGAERVGAGRNTPLDGGARAIVIGIEGQPVPEESRYDGIRVYRQNVESGYFDALGIALVRGRGFGPEDAVEGASSVIVSESLARRFRGAEGVDQDPIGRRLEYGEQTYTVVGVVGDVRHRNLIAGAGAPEDPDVYFSWTAAAPPSNFAVAVRSRLDPGSLISPLRDLLSRLEPRAVLYAVETIDERIGEQVASPRFSTVLLGLFSALALGLSALGLASVMGYDVASRRREIGIRMALGARAAGVLRMIVLEGLGLIAAGTACGLALALALTRLLETQLYKVSVNDLATFAAMTLLLVAVALVVTLVPARRAAAVDPIVSLRHE